MEHRRRVALSVLILGLLIGVGAPMTHALPLIGDVPPSSPPPEPPLWSSTFNEPQWPHEWAPAMDAHPDNRAVVWAGNGAENVLQLSASGDNDGFTGMGNLLRSWFTDLGLQPRDEAFLRYRVYIPAGWNPYVGGKLPGLAGLEDGQKIGDTPGGGDYDENGWSGRVMWKRPEDGNPDKTRLQSYLYVRSAAGRNIANNRSSDNGHIYGISVVFRQDPDPNNPGDTSKPLLYLKRGAWNTIETRYTMNSPGQSNGVFQAWLNGVLGVDLRDVQYRTAAHPGLSINELMFDTYYGGPTSNTSDQRWYFDDVSIRASY